MRIPLFAVSFLLAAAAAPAAEPAVHAIDHIGIGAADLDKGISFVEGKTGVRPVKGGMHPGRGTQNALMSLGGGTYLEVFAPVPGAKLSGEDAELLKMTTPKPIFFAVTSLNLDATARLLKENGYATTGISPGSRRRPDGSVLTWKTFSLSGPSLDAPFFIEWGKESVHPSRTSPGGCTLKSLEVDDKDPAALSKLFAVLGLDVATGKAPAAAVRLTLECPKGEVVLGP